MTVFVYIYEDCLRTNGIEFKIAISATFNMQRALEFIPLYFMITTCTHRLTCFCYGCCCCCFFCCCYLTNDTYNMPVNVASPFFNIYTYNRVNMRMKCTIAFQLKSGCVWVNVVCIPTINLNRIDFWHRNHWCYCWCSILHRRAHAYNHRMMAEQKHFASNGWICIVQMIMIRITNEFFTRHFSHICIAISIACETLVFYRPNTFICITDFRVNLQWTNLNEVFRATKSFSKKCTQRFAVRPLVVLVYR